jgi:hypothetical protein
MLMASSQDHNTTQESIEEMKALIEGTKQDLTDQAEQVEEAIRDAAESLHDRLRADRAQIHAALDTLAQAQQTANTTRPEVVIKENQAERDSRAIFGTDSLQPQFNLNVSNNTAGERTTMAAGVHSPETLQALLKSSGRSDVALLLQTMRSPLDRSGEGILQNSQNMITACQQTSSWASNDLSSITPLRSTSPSRTSGLEILTP